MSIADQIRQKLIEKFSPQELMVRDDSARHVGHRAARPEGETHFDVRIVSARFEGLSRIERQRLIHVALAEELKSRVHSLSLVTLTPAEVWQEH